GVLEDADGRIWIGTEAGGSRYDGIKVESFGPTDGVAPNGVRSLFRDKEGRIWAGHLGGGVSLFENKAFRTLQFNGEAITSDVTGIGQDLDGAIWLTTFGDGAIKVNEVPPSGVGNV